MNILAIETSCDETAAAVVEDGTKILSNVVASSTAMHEKYGGIVPEVAAREQLKCIIPVITEALKPLDRPAQRDSVDTRETFHAIHASESSSDQASVVNEVIRRNIDAIAVTVGPGLIGSLLVGVETAKTIAFITGKPIIPVNHVLAHMYANFINPQPIQFPAISLVVSGGHTELYLMKSTKNLTWLGGTLDDAAGECFDKTARLLGFGHGGGVAIEAAASRHSGKRVSEGVQNPNEMLDKTSMSLPRPMINDETLNFSFSGLKTAVMREWKKNHDSIPLPVIPAKVIDSEVTIAQTRRAGIQPNKNTGTQIKSGMSNEELITMFSYEIQEAITDVLVTKTLRAAKQCNAKSILLSGGVAANTRLREKFQLAISYQLSAISFFTPQVKLCTDNAVMIGACAFFRGEPKDWHEITAMPDLSVEV